MWSNFPNIIEKQSEHEYFELFISEYIEKDLKTHDWIEIKVQKGHFYHIFYRDKDKSSKYFDKWLARRILFLRSIIERTSDNIEVYEWFNSQSKRNERIYTYVYKKMCVVLWQEEAGTFYIITAYQKNSNELERLRKNNQTKRVV